MTDQPTTDIVADFHHTNIRLLINECLDIRCKQVFLEIEPES
jgi:hypothetical protein